MEDGPIPDDSVRSYAAWGDAPAWDLETGEDLADPEALQGLLDHVRWIASELAKDLLALREAARGVWRADGRRCPDVAAYKSWRTPEMAALIALLPEEPE